MTNVIVLRTENDEYFYERLIKMLDGDYPLLTLTSQMSEHLKIVEYELVINQMLYQFVVRNQVNQIDWFGKQKQHHLYNINSIQNNNL